jgi:hypothetical protein
MFPQGENLDMAQRPIWRGHLRLALVFVFLAGACVTP